MKANTLYNMLYYTMHFIYIKAPLKSDALK